MILPRVKHEEILGEPHALRDVIRYFAADAFGHSAASLLKYFIPTVAFVAVKARADADVIFDCRYNISDRDEFYTIDSSKLPIVINYRDFLGARNAAASFSQLISKTDGKYSFPSLKITDYPDSKMRLMLVDPARKLIPVRKMEEIIIRMAMAKYNYIQLNLSDTQGYAIKSDVTHYRGVGPEQYSKDDIRHIVKFAAMFGLECIPGFNLPAHSTTLLEEHPEFACITDGSEKPSTWAVCAGSELVYEFYEKMLAEIAELFPGKFIHICTDEIEMNYIKERPLNPTWHCCARCREMCEREGIDKDSITEVFYYLLRRVYDIVTGLGKRVMIWNENVDIGKVPELPRDILIQFWTIPWVGCGPTEGCSFNRFLEEGFEVVNCDHANTYIERDFYKNRDETIFLWHPLHEPEFDAKYASQILGGGPCAWSGADHFEFTLPTSIIMFGDRLWNASVCEDKDAFAKAMTRQELGIDVPEGFEFFTAFGGFMQPRKIDGTRMWVDRAAEDLSEVDAVLATLENAYTMSGRLATVYRDNIRWLNDYRAEQANKSDEEK